MPLKRLLTLPLLFLISLCVKANPDPVDSLAIRQKKIEQFMDSVNNALKYTTGQVKLEADKIQLNVPAGFKYLNKDQSKWVLTQLWGNPESAAADVDGMLFPAAAGPFADSSYAFIISYTEEGHIKDEDAGKIDYAELLKNLQSEEKEENAARVKAGYPSVHIVGWAQKPYYDEQRKILHWAKEIQFSDGDGTNTLNYQVRILGRKGMVSLNAVGKMYDLPLVNKDIASVLNIVTFTDGNSYKDFDPKIDKVAAWTIGGLVAGKLLLKAGVFAGLLKFLAPFWKFIIAFFVGIGAWFKRKLGRKKDDDLRQYTPDQPTEDPTPTAEALPVSAETPPALPESVHTETTHP
jgi:uncharacterized membrane-anchored protein